MVEIERGLYGVSAFRKPFERLCQLAQENEISFNFLVLQLCAESHGRKANKNQRHPRWFFIPE